ncbi:hypothetical protein QBC38DRAFT_367156 [Podospora fimiseda]|uniref:Transcription initiation factor TFIID subunit 2 n=1 Tax=Podospora fimiseda TaxID=252190 RepID=A0AAN7GX64_9PEZI|nr:hypothetical protein QBC38DRAFT_367156 [Podospora fimiseda]
MATADDRDAANEPSAVVELPSGTEGYVILRQEVAVEVNFQEKSVSGVSTIHIFLINPDVEEVMLDARQCEVDVDNITVDGFKTTAVFADPYDLLQVPKQWQIGAQQHHVLARRMKPLRPQRRPEVPNIDRMKEPCCVPCDRALKVRLRPEGMFRDERRPLKIKALRLTDDSPLDRPDPHDGETKGIKISIPFKSKTIRDGLHFVGVDDGDARFPHVYTRHSVEPGTASCIFPCVDDPGQRHPWTISIKCPRTLGDVFKPPAVAPVHPGKRKLGESAPAPAPSQYSALTEEEKLMDMTVVCCGNLTGEQIDPKDDKKRIMTFESQLSAAQHIAFAIGPFEHVALWSEFRTEEADEKLGANAAKIHAYCLPGRADEVRHACAPVVAAADYFGPEFGRYPFESYKMCFVEDLVDNTAAATSMSLCSTRLLYPHDSIDKDIPNTRILVHALATQYFGVHIVPNKRSDTWLVVGIQWFMTDLFMKTLCGKNWYKFFMKTRSDELVEEDVGRPSLHDLGEYLHIGDYELEFLSLKAPLILHMLEQRMTKAAATVGTTRIISQMVTAANIASTIENTSLCEEKFKRECDKKSSYKVDSFWDQWVKGSGCPKFVNKQKFNKKNLNVDITMTQTQGLNTNPRAITKEDFLRELQELNHDVWAAPVPKAFTGPFTLRIHEADGTPYEHWLEVKDSDKGVTSLSIPYNTKYKRMKRTKKATAAAANTNGDNQEDDVIYFSQLGDILGTPQDVSNWGFTDWSDNTKMQMDQESYEWIRWDCDFEWLCEWITDMPPYMYYAQLQQDPDVVAHQDAMLYYKRNKGGGVLATIETKTAMDRRYYHGIRVMAIEDLPKMADPDLNYIATAQLILIFRHFFCHKIVGKNGSVTYPPLPNDFSDKAQYAIQCALPGAIARTRENGRCSRQARNFLLDLLLFNDNSENEYSDQHYIGVLLEALTTSLIPEKHEGEKDLLSSLNKYDQDDEEFREFIYRAVEEIDKYRRMDEWTSTHQNTWTTTALNCKMRLMKAKVIPISPLEFVQYLQDDNLDLVRIKAFECLVELGQLAKAPIMKLLLSNVSTDPSPFVRDRLFKILCKGMAAVALGENKAHQVPDPDALMIDDGGLVIDQGEAEIQQRKLDATRNQSIQQTLAALKEELKGNTELQIVLWEAIESPYISAREKFNLLDLCSAMFTTDDSLLMTFNYPKIWRVTREPSMVNAKVNPTLFAENTRPKKECIMRFWTEYRTEPKNKKVPELAALPPLPESARPPEPKKIKLSSKLSFSGPSGSVPGTPSTNGVPVRKDSVSITVQRTPLPSGVSTASTSDSISVVRTALPKARVMTPIAASSTTSSPLPPSITSRDQPNGLASSRSNEKKPKFPPLKKRKSDDLVDDRSARNDGHDPRPPKKLVRVENGNGAHSTAPQRNGRRSKIVVVKFSAWDRLPGRIHAQLMKSHRAAQSSPSASSSIVATPLSRPGLSGFHSKTSNPSSRHGSPAALGSASSTAGTPGGVKQRKPLPSSAPSHNHSHGPPSTPGTAGGGDPPRKLIKLKLKPSGSSSSAASPATPHRGPI